MLKFFKMNILHLDLQNDIFRLNKLLYFTLKKGPVSP